MSITYIFNYKKILFELAQLTSICLFNATDLFNNVLSIISLLYSKSSRSLYNTNSPGHYMVIIYNSSINESKKYPTENNYLNMYYSIKINNFKQVDVKNLLLYLKRYTYPIDLKKKC